MGKNKYVFSSVALLTSCEDCQSSLIHNPYKAIDLYTNISTNTKKNYRYYVNTLRKMLKYEYPNLSEQDHLDLLIDFPLILAKLEQFFESQSALTLRYVLIKEKKKKKDWKFWQKDRN